jgi:hypothetical protein
MLPQRLREILAKAPAVGRAIVIDHRFSPRRFAGATPAGSNRPPRTATDPHAVPSVVRFNAIVIRRVRR